MATPEVIRFHQMNAADERRRVMLRIQNGTKAANPTAIGYRRTHRSFNGIKTTNGAGNTLFFVNKSDTNAPFASEMIGGVIKDFRAAKKLLAQRAVSSSNIRLAAEGAPPIESPLLELSEVESRSLELNNLLQQLQDAVDAGEITSALIPDLKNILRLFTALLPTFKVSELVDFRQFFGDQIRVLVTQEAEGEISASEGQVLRFLTKLSDVIKEFAPSADDTPEEKAIRARAIVRKVFKVDVGKLRPVRAVEEAGAAEAGAAEADAGDAAGVGAAEADAAVAPVDFAAAIDAEEPAVRARVGLVLKDRATALLRTLVRDKNKATLVELYDRTIGAANVRGETPGNIKNRIVARLGRGNVADTYRVLVRMGVPELYEDIADVLAAARAGPAGAAGVE
jgi:hypothetical protein